MFEVFWAISLVIWSMVFIGIFVFVFIILPIKFLSWMFGGSKTKSNPCKSGGAHDHDDFVHTHDHTHGVC